MKNYLWIALFTITLLHCQEEKFDEEENLKELANQQRNDNSVEKKLDPYSKVQGPDFFAQLYEQWSKRDDVSDEDKQKYAKLAQKIKKDLPRWEQSVRGKIFKLLYT